MKQTILIAEDNKTNRKILNRIFCEEYDILQAENGEEAIEHLNACEENIDILLLDLNMPQKNGYEVLAEMRSVAAFKNLPVIVITGEKDSDLEENLQSMGVFAVIRKPFDVKFLRKCVNEALQNEPDIPLEMKKERPLSLSNEQLSLIFDRLPYGIGIYEDAGGKSLLYRNEKFCEILGFADNSQMEDVQLFGMVFNEYRESVGVAAHNALLEENTGLERLQFPIINSKREALWIEAIFSGIKYTSDREKAILLVLNDITRQKLDAQKDTIIYEQMKYQFEHDQLTGLYNRSGFYAHIAQMMEDEPDKKYAMICCDISRFHIVNSVWSSEMGDKILASFGRVLQNLQDETGAVCCRMESDHFGIFIELENMDLEELQKKSLEEVRPSGVNYSVFLKFGVYEVENNDMPPEQMNEFANIALSAAKYDMLNTVVLYNDTMRKNILAEQAITREMECAIEQKQFEVYLQPIHSLSSGEPRSFEALARWNHPQRGMITPDIFIPVFERSGFIIKLDKYICERTCELMKKRRLAGKRVLPASVNMSRRSAFQTNIAQEMKNLIDKYELEPEMLSFEITETAYAESPAQLSDTINRLRRFGFKVMMDDFGSGYSSLNMLKEMPVDILKIDMKFLEGFENTARAGSIVAAIMRMARWLNIPVIAEGVETSEQIGFLYGIGCDWVQGYYFSKPIPADTVDDYLDDFRTFPRRMDNGEARPFYSNAFLGGDSAVNDLIDGISCGLSIVEMSDERLEIIRANRAYYQMLGYSATNFSGISRNIWQRMKKEERERERKSFVAAIETGKSQRILIKDFHADGHQLWMDCSINYLGGPLRNSVFSVSYIDISEQKKNEMQIDALKRKICDLERDGDKNLSVEPCASKALIEVNKLLIQETDTLIFEYNPDEDRMRVNYSNSKGERCIAEENNFMRDLYSLAYFKEEQAREIEKRFNELLSRPMTGEMLFMMDLHQNKSFCWYRASLTSIAGSNNSICSLVGRADNVDAQISGYTYTDGGETARDRLSGINDRAAAENMIQSILQKRHGYCALFVIDLDDFKKVNNKLGHLFGDAFIKEFGSRLKMVFRGEDIVGRYGGDEFFAFIQDIRDISVVKKRAVMIKNAALSIAVPENSPVGCSIGIAMISPEAKNFEDVFANADKALHEIKRNGKGDFKIEAEI